MFKQNVIQRYKGFNLLGMFASADSVSYKGRALGYFEEEDFRMISDFGFNFVRLPLSYRVWSTPENPCFIDEEKIKPLDDAVEYGKNTDFTCAFVCTESPVTALMMTSR